MGFLQKTKLLDNHHTVFFDNYFNSCELLEEMYRDTYSVGKFYQGTPPFTISLHYNFFSSKLQFPNNFYLEQKIPLFIAGTVRGNRKGLPQAVAGKQVKLKCGEKVFQQKGNLLCLKWVDKRPVAICHQYTEQLKLRLKSTILGNLQ